MKKKKKKSTFDYKAADGTEFSFNDYTKLLNFAEDLYQENLSFDEARDEKIIKNIKND